MITIDVKETDSYKKRGLVRKAKGQKGVVGRGFLLINCHLTLMGKLPYGEPDIKTACFGGRVCQDLKEIEMRES